MRLVERVRSVRGPLAAVAVTLVFSAALFARGHPYDQDQLALNLPYATVLRGAVARHSFPLWTDLIWCGYPIHAEGQGGFLAFPFRAVALLAPDVVTGIELETTLALALAALAAGLAARLLGRSHTASATAGVLWALGGGLLSYQENPAVLEACFALPLLVALGRTANPGGIGGAGGPPRRTAVLAAGALVGLLLLAGWPYALVLVLPLLVFTWRWRELALALGLGLLLGAAQWIPTAELFLHSDRASGLSPAEVLGQGALAPWDLRHLVSPLIDMSARLGTHSVVFAYLGLPAAVLAAIGARREIAARRFLFPAAFVLALVLAVLPALAPGLASVLVAIPPLSFVRGPSKLLLVAGLAASFLAAEGVDAFPRRARLAFAIVALDLFQFGQRKALIVERDVLRTIPEVTAAIPKGARVHALEAFALAWTPRLDAATFREGACVDPDENVLASVPVLGGYGPLPVGRSRELARAATVAFLARAGVSYLVAPLLRVLPGLAPARRFASVNLYELPPAAPLARLVASAVTAEDPGRAFELASRLPATTAVLEEPVAGPFAAGEARLEGPGEGTLSVDVTASGKALLVLAFTWFPGWHATVDGAPAPVRRADYAFMGVELPGPGTAEQSPASPAPARRVELRYEPATFRAGLLLSALGLLVLLGRARPRPS
jgi:hypothetical protein